MGSEMCIRDSSSSLHRFFTDARAVRRSPRWVITDVYHASTPLRAPVHETNAQTTPPPRDETTPPRRRREVPSRRRSTTSRPRRAMKNPRARESVTIQPFDLFIIQYQYTPRASPAFLRRRRPRASSSSAPWGLFPESRTIIEFITSYKAPNSPICPGIDRARLGPRRRRRLDAAELGRGRR